MFEPVSVRLERFIERSDALQTIQFAYRKGLGTGDAVSFMTHTLPSPLESGQEALLVDFSAVLDMVNHH